MGSEGPSVVTVHVTGFKKFHGVAENPTEKIVSNLRSFMEERGLPKNLVLGSCEILETAGQGALGALYKVLESAAADRENGSSAQGQIIWIHFGVNSGASRFALENQAVNEATFRCPDELGWKPQRVPIVPSDGSISRIRETTLPVKELTKSLRKTGYDVLLSDDAGRFVCNYVYYHSLRFAEEHGIKGDLQFLESFSTYENQFSGKFPANLGRFSPLNAIDISENFFSGEFPKFLCQNKKLQFLLALSNNFSGEFPSSYSSCKALERFRVSQNQFTGSIPYGMWGLPNAVIIDVADNGFIGGISSDIGISATLNQLLVQNNNFSGELPMELGNLSQLQKLVASNNRFSGQIPTPIGNLKQLSYLHLEHNAMEGSIPSEIGLCNSLVDLNLAENSLSGKIPDTLGSLLVLNSLNLSHNMISDEIPEGLQSLKLSYVDFSHNNLSGPIPPQLLMIAGDDAFSENSDLCVTDTSEGWRQFGTTLRSCQWADNHHNFSQRRLFAVLIMVSSFVILLSGLACLRYENNRLEVFNRKRDTESGDDSDSKWIVESFRPQEVNPSAALPVPMVT